MDNGRKEFGGNSRLKKHCRMGKRNAENNRQDFYRVTVCWHVETHNRASLRSKETRRKTRFVACL